MPGLGVGIEEGQKFVLVGGAADAGQLVVYLLAALGGQAGDDDLDLAGGVGAGDTPEQARHGVVFRLDGEDEPVFGIILVQQHVDIAGRILVNPFDRQDDRDGGELGAKRLCGHARSALGKHLGDAERPDRQQQGDGPEQE